MKINLSPRKAKPLDRRAKEAWFYENTKSIDVYIYIPGSDALSCRITRAQLKDWLRRTEPKP